MISSIIEALDGVSISQSSEHSGRALCHEYFCENASTKTEPAAYGQAKTLLKAYQKADSAYSQAASAFGNNKKARDDYQSAITTNLELSQGTQETVQGIQNATDDLKTDFLITAACTISTICCKTAPGRFPRFAREKRRARWLTRCSQLSSPSLRLFLPRPLRPCPLPRPLLSFTVSQVPVTLAVPMVSTYKPIARICPTEIAA